MQTSNNTNQTVERKPELRGSYPTIWKAVKYGIHQGEICRICKWVSYSDMPGWSPDTLQRYTLYPLSGNRPFCGLLDGEFTAYTEEDNELVRKMIALAPTLAKPDEYEPVWKD